jgi:hypothetical protein
MTPRPAWPCTRTLRRRAACASPPDDLTCGIAEVDGSHECRRRILVDADAIEIHRQRRVASVATQQISQLTPACRRVDVDHELRGPRYGRLRVRLHASIGVEDHVHERFPGDRRDHLDTSFGKAERAVEGQRQTLTPAEPSRTFGTSMQFGSKCAASTNNST